MSRRERRDRHLLVPVTSGPGGVRTAVCPVCREPTAVPDGGGERLHLRCRTCGVEFVAVDESAPPESRRRHSPRQVFLRESGVLVTDTRFVAPGFALPVERVIRCRVDVVPGRWVWPREVFWGFAAAVGLLAVAGLPAVLALDSKVPVFPRLLGFAVGLALVALSAGVARFAWQSRYFRLDQFEVLVATVGGEVRAFSDADEEFARRVEAALTAAVDARNE